MRWILILLMLCLPVAATAQHEGDLDFARAEFALGNAAYGESEWRSAIRHFEAANAAVPNARLLEYIARCHAQLNEFGQALAMYEAYAATSPEAAAEVAETIEQVRASSIEFAVFEAMARVHAMIADAHGEMPEGRDVMRSSFDSVLRDAVVQIRSEPRGAEIFVNDVSLGSIGRTPLQSRMFTGSTYIEVRLPNHEPEGRLINITPGVGDEIPVFDFVLTPIEVPVTISVEPLTASATWIGADGTTRALGIGGWEGSLPAGPAAFLLQQGGRDRRIEVDIQPAADGSPVALTLSVRETSAPTPTFAIGTLIIVSEAVEGSVYVDGRRLGDAPDEFEVDLTPGEHTVELRRENRCTWSQTIEVEANDDTRIYTPNELQRRCR